LHATFSLPPFALCLNMSRDLQMSDAEFMGLIKSGKIQARKVDGQFRVERGILDLFSGKKSL
ncbi:MAG: hypothetical protein ABI947_24840, partial [Chloroflexota bacterium]